MKSILITLKCSRCGFETHVKSETFIHADFESNLTNKILDNTFFLGTCPKCHQHIPFLHECLYIDQKHKYMLLLKVNGSSTSTIQETGHMRYLRLVTSADELKEKIRIFNDGLYDQPMEALKLRLSQKLNKDIHTIYYFDYDKASKSLWFTVDDEIKGIPYQYYEQLASKKYEESKDFIKIQNNDAS